MKKLTRKLFLSIAALACCAATLVSTTFAWYINNPTASANVGTGTVAGASTDGSLTISKTENGTYGRTIDLGNGTGSNLNPVSYDATSKKFSDSTGTEMVTQTDAYLEWTFYLKCTTEATPTVLLTATNTTTELVKQQAFVTDGLPSGTAVNSLFAVDAVTALRMGVMVGSETTMKVYDVHNVAVGATGEDYEVDDTTYLTGANAHTYYAAVNDGTAAWKVSPTDGALSTEITCPQLVADTPTVVTIRVWLEGADDQCFNSCGSQTFSFDLDFSI